MHWRIIEHGMEFGWLFIVIFAVLIIFGIVHIVNLVSGRRETLREGFDKAVSKSALENFHFHDLRHTFATRLVQAGVDLYKVKELLGHKTITMTMRYAHHYPESLRSSVEVLDSYQSASRFGHVLDGSV